MPNAHVRPTKDRVRESVFSSLGEHIVGARVLDLYAGSGAMGLEALSRGAEQVTFIEQNPAVFRVLCENVAHVAGEGSDQVSVQCRDASRVKGLVTAPFNLVLADPPYDETEGNPLLQKTLLSLAGSSMLQPRSVLIFEQGASMSAIDSSGWELIKTKEYGQTVLLWYRYLGEQ